MIAINGMGSAIAKALIGMLPEGEKIEQMRLTGPAVIGDGAKYVFAQGYLSGRSIGGGDDETEFDTWKVNFVDIAARVDFLLEADPRARIVVIGSESAFSGSHDMAYAGAKAALHLYVETKALQAGQQLVAIAPGIIGDAGMTTRRSDGRELARRALAHPKGRFVTSLEVARLIHFLLYVDEGYLSGTVIRMHGGGR